MTQETLNFVKEQTEALIAAPSCSAEAKAAAEKWLAAVGTAEEAEATKAYIAELEDDILAHAKEIKADGAAYCDCPACAACKAILDKKAELL